MTTARRGPSGLLWTLNSTKKQQWELRMRHKHLFYQPAHTRELNYGLTRRVLIHSWIKWRGLTSSFPWKLNPSLHWWGQTHLRVFHAATWKKKKRRRNLAAHFPLRQPEEPHARLTSNKWNTISGMKQESSLHHIYTQSGVRKPAEVVRPESHSHFYLLHISTCQSKLSFWSFLDFSSYRTLSQFISKKSAKPSLLHILGLVFDN